jgi:hypothetical protein
MRAIVLDKFGDLPASPLRRSRTRTRDRFDEVHDAFQVMKANDGHAKVVAVHGEGMWSPVPHH